ncbi:MAG: glycosyltransferase family 2 protein [candidate division KSB1 bacterium]|nr:glycosyltransferase family 2 protein [candidate division KSB1 bacterium]
MNQNKKISTNPNFEKKLFSFIVINYNAYDYTSNCLKSITKFCSNYPYEIIVIDNASSDGSIFKLEAEFRGVIFKKNEQNLGFAKACNQGIDLASGDFLIFLNNDFEFKTDIFERIIEKYQRYENLGLLGFQLLNPDGTLQKTDFKFPTIPRRILQLTVVPLIRKYRSNKLPDGERKDRIVDYIKGALMIVPAKLLNQLQLRFDENYFMYHEEMDLAFQLRKQGKICILDTTPAGIHYGQHVEDVHEERVFLWRNQNYLFFFRKYYSRTKLLSLIAGNIIIFSLKWIIFFPCRSLRYTYQKVICMSLKAL